MLNFKEAQKIFGHELENYAIDRFPAELYAPVKDKLRIPMTEEQRKLFGIDKLNVPRSQIPAITWISMHSLIQQDRMVLRPPGLV